MLFKHCLKIIERPMPFHVLEGHLFFAKPLAYFMIKLLGDAQILQSPPPPLASKL